MPGASLRRRRPSPPVWKWVKGLYRWSIRLRARFYLIPALFTSKEMMLNDAVGIVECNKVRGDYFEFGTYEGNAFIAAYHLSKRQGIRGMRFFAFDSFKGLPELRDVDLDREEDLQFAPGDFACDEAAFRRNLRGAGVAEEDVVLVPGYYEDSLKPDTNQRLKSPGAAIVLVDCDLYHSAVRVLDFLTDHVLDGTLLIFDDWFNFKGDPERGEQKAFREWLGRNGHIRAVPYRHYGWHGTSFILHRRPAAAP